MECKVVSHIYISAMKPFTHFHEFYNQNCKIFKESILIGGDIVEQITKPKLSQLVHISWTIYCNVGIDMKINFKCIHVCNNVVAWC